MLSFPDSLHHQLIKLRAMNSVLHDSIEYFSALRDIGKHCLLTFYLFEAGLDRIYFLPFVDRPNNHLCIQALISCLFLLVFLNNMIFKINRMSEFSIADGTQILSILLNMLHSFALATCTFFAWRSRLYF